MNVSMRSKEPNESRGNNLKNSKINSGILILAGLLLAAIIACTVPSAINRTAYADGTPSNLTVTLTTDRESYEKGQTIQISGTVKDQDNNPVASGTVTIQLLYGAWSRKTTAQIDNGIYSDNFYISFGTPPLRGSGVGWTITGTAVDDLGNSGTSSKTITVSIPRSAVYAVQFLSPAVASYFRGENTTIAVTVTTGEENVENATVIANSPKGENISLSMTAPGTYSTQYGLKFDDPTGNWSISVEAKTPDNKAGGSWVNVTINPATLEVTLLDPTQTAFEIESLIEVKVQVSYPFDGGPVENATVTINSPTGENLPVLYENLGIYSAEFISSSEDIGAWTINATASDSNGNSGSASKIVNITEKIVPGFLSQYWWVILPAILAAALASAYVVRGKRLAGRLEDVQKEMKEIPRLKKEAAIKYFKNGSISRSAYDGLIKRYDARMDELKKQEAALRAKVKKKK